MLSCRIKHSTFWLTACFVPDTPPPPSGSTPSSSSTHLQVGVEADAFRGFVCSLCPLHMRALQVGVEVEVPENCIQKVGEFKLLALRAEQDGHLRQRLQHVLKLSKEKWEEARDHAMRAVVAGLCMCVCGGGGGGGSQPGSQLAHWPGPAGHAHTHAQSHTLYACALPACLPAHRWTDERANGP